MQIAMEKSLLEAEDKKAQERPMAERSGMEIVEHFKGSPLVVGLGEEVAVELLDGENETEGEEGNDGAKNASFKAKIVEYLEMERRCQRWYSCSSLFFQDKAKEAVVLLPMVENTSGGGKERNSNKGEVGRVLVGYVDGVLAELQRDVFALPAEGTKEALPACFTQYAGKEEIQLLDE